MAEKYFKLMVAAFFCIAGLSLCVGVTTPDENYNVSVTQIIDADKGLDLRAVGEVLKKAKDAAAFEALLNDSQSGVNNLDLNADGKVDYIHVTEFGDDAVKGFSLTTEVARGEVQEVATIKIQKGSGGEAEVEYQGNSAIYGQNHYYRSHWSPGLGTGLMLGYLFTRHRPYYSPWGGGSYPGSYRPYSTVPHGTYSGRRRSGDSSYSSSRRSTVGGHLSSPNSGRNATSVKARLKNPTSSQKGFQARRAAKTKGSGGFGRSSSSRFGRSSSLRRGSRSHSSRSFGGK